MASPVDLTAFVSGEISPSLYGRVDIDKERVAATTLRNLYVNYRGGANSRAGTSFVGFSKQTGRNFPPRVLDFQFSINQGLMLEFGNFYMRVVFNGEFVTENPVAIGGATQAKPTVLTFGAEGAVSATPNDAGVTVSYAPGDLVTLAGGMSLSEAVLQVLTSQLVSLLVASPGTGYTVGDTVTLGGGTSTTSAVATVTSVGAIAASGSISFVNNPNDGDTVTLNSVTWTFKTTPTTSTETAIQPTLAGTMAQLATDLNASANASLTVATYSSTPTALDIVDDTPGTGGNAYTLAASVGTPSSGTLTGGSTSGITGISVTTMGVFTVLPANGLMTQASTSGGGSAATFQTAVFGPNTVSVQNPGAYTAVPANPVAQDSTTGIGVGAAFTVTWGAVPAFNNGDWIVVNGVQGMTELNGNAYVVAGATATTVQLLDVYGNQIDSSGFGAYTGAGTAARIYTLATPYAEADLPYLKITQSADVMTLCCVNQETETEYIPQNLTRLADDDWTFSPVVSNPSIAPPSALTAVVSSGTGSTTTYYAYVVTAVSPVDGSESIASPIATAQGIPISTQQGQVSLSWKPVPNVNEYNIYKAQPSFGTPVPAGALYGYVGSAYGTAFNDTNINPDFSQVPPLHTDPFARGQIIGVNIISGGSGYTTAGLTLTTATGAGFAGQVVLQNGAVVAVIIKDAGHDYEAGDTVQITGNGHGATGTLSIGAEMGTYPSVPGYFQERRAFANSINNPDTYWMSQPGAFENFDVRIPTIDTDAITGSPWAVQVNGIQFIVQTAGGLLVLTGQSAWLLVGAGTFATNVQEFTPSSQDATPQPFTGCSPLVPPIKINYDVIYVSAKGSFYYDLPYQLYVLSEPIDLTQYSAHLFIGHTILEHAWCEQPYKVLWAVRDDGTMLSLTYLKAEQLAGWARHDTNGLFQSVCSVTEPPVDALYMATQRFIAGSSAYMIERMNNRIWGGVEDVWAVDCGLSLPQPAPNSSITADLPNGIGSVTGVTGLIGGTGYSASTTAAIVDDDGQGLGTGAIPALTIVGGVITAVSFGANQGSGYTRPALVITDPENSGSGAFARPVLNTTSTFIAAGPVFSVGDVGSVIRMGGGIAQITSFVNAETVLASVLSPIIDTIPNSGGMVSPQPSGAWTMTAPVTKVTGLEYLAGATVTGLADGNVVTPRVVAADGSVTLDTAASSVTLGLGFQAQLQSVYLDAGSPTIQGQRKKVAGATVRAEASRGLKMGSNQVDGSTLNPPQVAPPWLNLDAVPDFGQLGQPKKPYNGLTIPLYSSDVTIPLTSGFQKNGQVALQQDYPLPMNILSIVPVFLEGDVPEQQVQSRQAGRQ